MRGKNLYVRSGAVSSTTGPTVSTLPRRGSDVPHRIGAFSRMRHVSAVPLPSTALRSLGCRLELMTGDAKRLQVGVVISPALGNVDDVVYLKV